MATTPVQLTFSDVEIDPTHWHVVQGFEEGGGEMLLSSHADPEDAQRQMEDYIAQVYYYEDASPLTSSEWQADYKLKLHGDEGFILGWIRTVQCGSWVCVRAAQSIAEDG